MGIKKAKKIGIGDNVFHSTFYFLFSEFRCSGNLIKFFK